MNNASEKSFNNSASTFLQKRKLKLYIAKISER